MTPTRTGTNREVRHALMLHLAHGRAITTTELRTRLSEDGFDGVTQETVYRHLDAMARAGDIRRLRHAGRRHIFWTRRQATSALLGRDHR
ncbi:LexA family transcriptional regulator [Mycolicibacterium llatzerense]|uniref:hypothetical protein n=1 Tax=Mycolicibacterium llatzerense TaxID=280871 RepID=UPI0021B4EE43|nr:hypothetical protein [Mycolicibacterium llatzerense]MCT7373010.1 hypothetical protein [Mycolicibacterium llatzerense]